MSKNNSKLVFLGGHYHKLPRDIQRVVLGLLSPTDLLTVFDIKIPDDISELKTSHLIWRILIQLRYKIWQVVLESGQIKPFLSKITSEIEWNSYRRLESSKFESDYLTDFILKTSLTKRAMSLESRIDHLSLLTKIQKISVDEPILEAACASLMLPTMDYI